MDLSPGLRLESKLLVNPNVVDILQGRGFGDAGEPYPKILVPVLLKADADANHRAQRREIARLLPHGNLVHMEGPDT